MVKTDVYLSDISVEKNCEGSVIQIMVASEVVQVYSGLACVSHKSIFQS